MPQQMTMRFTGDGAKRLFSKESGGHRWQRIPPTERGGRVHSSTVTVAVLGEEKKTSVEIRESDLRIDTFCASGPGGQKVNKVETAIRIVHKPTGLVVKCQDEKSQKANKEKATAILRARLHESAKNAATADRAKSRKEQVGSGERSDKIRTVQVQNGIVTNHITGKKIPLKRYLKGELSRIA